MGLFEEYPILLVPLIVATVAGYDIVKRLIRRGLDDTRDARRR
jgi:hypothetical protein